MGSRLGGVVLHCVIVIGVIENSTNNGVEGAILLVESVMCGLKDPLGLSYPVEKGLGVAVLPKCAAVIGIVVAARGVVGRIVATGSVIVGRIRRARDMVVRGVEYCEGVL